MTDKEFKRLRRSDLIEILYEYQQREKALQEEIAALRAALADRELKIRDAGTLAEAVVRLNGLFEAAQKTADDYVEQVRLKTERERKAAAEAAAEQSRQTGERTQSAGRNGKRAKKARRAGKNSGERGI